MAVDTDYVAALPTSGSADKTALRNALVARAAYVLFDADTVTDLVAVDPASGAAIIDILYKGRLFHYDATDTTSASDGVSVLVSHEGRRYKLSDSSGVPVSAVLNATTSAPPVSPSIGDAYLVAAGATGAWSGEDNNVAYFSRRGWEFLICPIGKLLYVEDTDSYMHLTSGGSWELGFGTQALVAGSVPITAVQGAHASFVVGVENQTTNAPPASPVVPTAYIIGPSPTGSWAGNAGKLARCQVAGSFTIISPVAGDTVYDKSLQTNVTFNGSAWAASAGSWVGRNAVQTASGSTTAPSGTTAYTYSSGTAPTTSIRRLIDTATLAYTAKRSGSTMRFHYSADAILTATASPTGSVVIALFRDSVVNAIDWQIVPMADVLVTLSANSLSGASATHLDHWFEVAALDTSAHTYTIAITSKSGGGGAVMDASALTRRTFEVEESA